MNQPTKLISYKELEKLKKNNPLISAICKDRINYINNFVKQYHNLLRSIGIDSNNYEIRIKK